jgi:hypothetical protein
MGQLGTTGQADIYGRQGMGLGMQGAGIGQMGLLGAMPAFGAGQQFAQQVTDPRSMQSFMSPYQQQVTDVAKAAAVREAQIASQQANLGAARQGTYGGARQALQQSERERSLLANLSNIQAQGSQSAFDRAMQAQQFGANLGLQGIQTGLQGTAQGMQGIGQGMQGVGLGLQGVGAQQAGFAGAGQAGATLGNLGGAQQQADLARMGFQNQLGNQQQQFQQNIINQAIQDYATQQQYPMMQLGFMSNMLRGLPMQATTTQSYQAQPNLTTQAISGLGTAAGAYRAFGFKEGGKVPGYAGPEGSVVSGMKAKLEALADSPGGEAQVARIAQTSTSQEMRALANEVLLDKEQEKRAAAQAEQSIARDQGMGKGLAAAPAPVMDTMNAAGGGIVAFANEGQVEEDEYTKYIANVQRMRERAGVTGSPVDPKLKAMYEERIAGLPGRRESDVGMDMIDFFSRMNRPGSIVKAATDAAQEALPGIAKRRADLRAEELAATTGLAGLTKDERAEQLGITKEAMALRENELNREQKLEAARIGATPRDTFTDRLAAQYFKELVTNQQMDPKDPATKSLAMKQAVYDSGLAGGKLNIQSEAQIIKGEKDSKELPRLRRELLQLEPGSPEYVAKQAEIQTERDKIRANVESKTPGRPEAPKPEVKPGGGKFSNSGAVVVQTPAGPINFPNKEAADAYRKAAGLNR